jgi:hypothetical protein
VEGIFVPSWYQSDTISTGFPIREKRRRNKDMKGSKGFFYRAGVWIGVLTLSGSLFFLEGCGKKEKHPLGEYCGEETPRPSYPYPNQVVRNPPTPPHKEVRYIWFCLNGDYVEEVWSRSGDCWVREEEIRRKGGNCPAETQ